MKTTRQIFATLALALSLTVTAQNNVVSTTATSPTTYGNLSVIVGVNAGTAALSSGTSAFPPDGNTFIGHSAGTATNRSTVGGSPELGSFNTFVGLSSGAANTTAYYNTALGSSSLWKTTTGIENVALGSFALRENITGSQNVAVGNRALLGSTGEGNIGIGDRALGSTFGGTLSGNLNVGIGKDVGVVLSTGSRNTFIGTSSGGSVISGSFNTFIGNVGSTNDISNTIILADGNGAQRFYNVGNATGINLGNNVVPLHGLDVRGNMAVGDATYTGAAGTLTNGMIVQGNVGIGTNTPGNKLEINSGTTNVSGLRLTGYIGQSATVNNPGQTFLAVNASGDVVKVSAPPVSPGLNVSVASGSIVSARNIYTHDGSLDTVTVTPTTASTRTVTMGNNNLFFNTAGSASGYGRIYIGGTVASPSFPPITSTSNYRLLVEGGILTEKVKVAMRYTGSDWADYVFADGYKLMPLREIESFIKANKHLPGIESAEELQKEGLDLGDMQRKQMEKIEELTLHLIEQNKTVEKQSKEIEELKSLVNALLEKK